jgi:hypothetical protein
MAKKTVASRPASKEAQPLTLADVTITHASGSKVTTRTGETLARLIEATRHLHDDSETDLDFLNPSAIASELEGVADVLCCLSEAEGFGLERALPCIGEQLRRIGHRVTALGARSGNNHPAWYKVEVKR